MIIVDTSVLIDFLKGTPTTAAAKLRHLESEDLPYSLPAICCQEVLQCAKNQKEWRLLLDHLQSQHIVHPRDSWTTHVDAARIYYDCRRKGMTIRSSVDCFIAQLVLEHEGLLLHDDEDFVKISRVRPLRMLE